MALYSNAEGPGEWRSFLKRNDIRNLTLQEQKKKYLVEQLQFEDFISQQAISRQLAFNSLSAQNRVAGNIENKVINAVFNATPALQSITSNTTFIDVVFQEPVLVDDASGIPTISVTNNKQGGGSVSPVVYTYVNNNSQSKLVRFSHTHPASPNNDGGIAAHVITVGTDLAGNASGTISGGAAAEYNGVPFTGLAGVSDIVADCILDASGVLDTIVFQSQATPSYAFKPTDQLSIDAAALGSGGTGTVVVTIFAADLTGDVLTMVGSTIAENGGEIYSAAINPDFQLDLSYTSTSTKTAVAS
tara:strand:- start:928 stop:1833 length:906 start_codon:yes stop_codon:yes gene_type:complete